MTRPRAQICLSTVRVPSVMVKSLETGARTGQCGDVATMTQAEVIAALRAMLEREVAADRFSGTVLVGRIENRAGVVLFSEAYGVADREGKVPNTLDTRFRIASMNKMFTATSIMLLVQAGKIELTAPLVAYVTDYPNKNVASS